MVGQPHQHQTCRNQHGSGQFWKIFFTREITSSRIQTWCAQNKTIVGSTGYKPNVEHGKCILSKAWMSGIIFNFLVWIWSQDKLGFQNIKQRLPQYFQNPTFRCTAFRTRLVIHCDEHFCNCFFRNGGSILGAYFRNDFFWFLKPSFTLNW